MILKPFISGFLEGALKAPRPSTTIVGEHFLVKVAVLFLVVIGSTPPAFRFKLKFTRLRSRRARSPWGRSRGVLRRGFLHGCKGLCDNVIDRHLIELGHRRSLATALNEGTLLGEVLGVEGLPREVIVDVGHGVNVRLHNDLVLELLRDYLQSSVVAFFGIG